MHWWCNTIMSNTLRGTLKPYNWFWLITVIISINYLKHAVNLLIMNIAMVCSTNVLCPQNLLSRKSQIQRLYVPLLWTYHICALDTGTYYGYNYWQHHDILQWHKQSKHFLRITGNKWSTLHATKKLRRPNNNFTYRKQIARQLWTQYVEGINSNPVTLKSTLWVTQDHWKCAVR